MTLTKDSFNKLSNESKLLYKEYLEDIGCLTGYEVEVLDIKINNQSNEYIEIRLYTFLTDRCYIDFLFNKETKELDTLRLDRSTNYYHNKDYEITYDNESNTIAYQSENIEFLINEELLNFTFKLDRINISCNLSSEGFNYKFTNKNLMNNFIKGSVYFCDYTMWENEIRDDDEIRRYIFNSEFYRSNQLDYTNFIKDNNELKYYFIIDNKEKCLSLFIDEEKEIILKELFEKEVYIHHYSDYNHIVTYKGKYKSVTHYRKNQIILYFDSNYNIYSNITFDDYLLYKVDSSYKDGADLFYEACKYRPIYPFKYRDDILVDHYLELAKEKVLYHDENNLRVDGVKDDNGYIYPKIK